MCWQSTKLIMMLTINKVKFAMDFWPVKETVYAESDHGHSPEDEDDDGAEKGLWQL